MAVYDFPTFGGNFFPSNSDAMIMSNSEMDISSINNSQRISENPGEGWEVSYKFGVLYPEDARKLKGFLQKLRGHMHAARLIDTTYSHAGTWSGTPLVDGAGQYGLALNIKGATPNTTIAYASDRFALGSQLHELVADAVTDATGKCTLQLANEVRTPTTNNAALITTLNQLFITCRWSDPTQIRQFKGSARLFRNITLDWVEKR